MWPSLRSGDWAEVEPLQGQPRPGEVVLARLAHALVVHRVRRCEADTYVLRGDNSDAEDLPLRRSQVLGRVGRVRRGRAVLGREQWDLGPRRWGRWRVVARRVLQRLVGRERRV